MSTADRMADGYEPRFDIDQKVGRQGELFIASTIDALIDGASVETKTDERALETGNLFVEFKCYRLGKWQRSGIATTTAEVWVFVLGQMALCIPTETLKPLARIKWREGRITRCVKGSHPTQGILVPIDWLVSQMRPWSEAA